MKLGWEIAVETALRPPIGASKYTILYRKSALHNARMAVRWDGVPVDIAITRHFHGIERKIALAAVSSLRFATESGWY